MPEYRLAIVIDGQDNASPSLNGLKGTLSGLGGAATTMLAGLGAAAGSGFFALAAGGIAANASMEQTKAAFSTLLGSAETAGAFLKDLGAFAAATPFEFPELADASKKLLAFGFAAEDIIPMMTSIGDAVGALGGGKAEIDRVTMAMGQMSAKGKVSAEEMGQLAELGIPAWKMLADSMGLSTAEVMKLAEQGKITADQAIPALLAGMENTFGGAMQGQAMTFNGLMSTLADNARMALMAFTGPIFAMAKGALEQLGTAVSSPAFQLFAQTLGTQIGAALATLIPWLSAVGGQLMSMAQQALPGLLSGWAMLQGGLATAQAMFASMLPVISPLIALIGANLMPILAGVAGVLLGVVVVAIGGAIAAFVAVAAPILAMIAVGALLYAAWTSNFAGVQTITTSVMQTIMQIIQTVLTSIQSYWATYGSQIMALATQLWQTIETVIRTVLATVLGVVQIFLATLRGDWQGAWTAVVGIFQAQLAMLQSIFGPALSALLTTLSGMATRFMDSARTIGTAIIDGIVAGIRAGASAIAEAARGAANAAIRAAKSALGINSPSTQFAYLGDMSTEGFLLPFRKALPNVRKATGDLANAATSGAQAAGTTSSQSTAINLTYYRGNQDERSVRDDLRTTALLMGA